MPRLAYVILAAAAAPGLTVAQPFILPTLEVAAPTDQRKKRKALRSAPVRHRRCKGAQAKPRKRSNRLTIGKRVRRKHRRAA